MIHTAQEITDIANQIKARIEKEYNTKLDHTIIGAVYDEEDQYWIAIGSYELLGKKESFFYHISDKTGELIKTLDKDGYDTYLPEEYTEEEKEILKEWDEYEKERPEDFI